MDDAPVKVPVTGGHNCPQCGTTLDAQDRFCRSCGLEQNVDAAAVGSAIARILPGRVDAALKERLREQKVVEVETAELLAERAMKWLKTLGFFLGIPVLLVVAIFSFVGIKAWSDLQNVASQTLNLQRNLTEPQQRLSQAIEQIKQLQANLDDAQKTFAGRISEVNRRQNSLEDQLTVIRSRLDFCPGVEPSPVLKEKLQDALSRFIVWLQSIGFDKLDDHIAVCIFSKDSPLPADFNLPSDQPNALYANNTLFIHKDLSDDLSIALREFSLHALTNTKSH